MNIKVLRCAFWHLVVVVLRPGRVHKRLQRDAIGYWPRTASMEDWLVFWMGVATIRILIWNVTRMLYSEYEASAVCVLVDTY